MAGYSGTPLPKKLGIKDGFRVWFVNAPQDFDEILNLSADTRVIFARTKPLDLILFFTKSASELRRKFVATSQKLAANGMLWVCWPKKASGVETDVNENLVREIGLNAGLVDVKICAVSEVWSGLKFVYRLKDRPQA
jgi:hypothetical protein